MTRALILVVLLLAAPASAADWLLFCRSGATTTALKPGEWACNIPTSSTDDSGSLGVALCENVTARYYDDVDGDTTAGGGTVIVRSCPSSTADTDGCWSVEDLTLDGDPSTGTEAIYGFDSEWIMVDVTAYATTTEPIQVNVKCSLPRT